MPSFLFSAVLVLAFLLIAAASGLVVYRLYKGHDQD